MLREKLAYSYLNLTRVEVSVQQFQLAYSGHTLSDLNDCVLARASETLQTFLSHDNPRLGEPGQSRVPGNVEEN